MNIKTAEFLKSSHKIDQCPETTVPEFAFIGRSNVGKSSLINMLCNRNALAKVSNTPGKTQLINHFNINTDEWLLVDLPGYGYAKVPKAIKSGFDIMIRTYLKNRTNLIYTFVLVDSRHNPQKVDLDFINWLGKNEIPFGVIFTKTDKLKKLEFEPKIQNYKNTLLETWDELPPCFISSSAHKIGQTEILDFIGASITKYA